MKVRHLFSGGGNDAWGFRKAGMSIVDMAEARPERRELLRQMYPEAKIYDDVRSMDERSIDLVAGGPPCQRTSVASAIFGKRTGETLWPAMFQHCLDAKWVVVEQPPGNKAWEAQVKTDLEGSGFHARRLEYAASDLGAPHIRRRVFILAHRDLSRLEIAWRSVPSEIERFAGGGVAGNPWLAYPPGGLRVADGLAGTPRTAGARDAIEMLGDGIPWPMTYVLARAVLASAGQMTDNTKTGE
jgi:site-specific DNA-cytosine methylase